MGMTTRCIRPYRNQAEGEVGAKGGGSGPAASSHTATDSNTPSGGREGGGGPNPQLNNSPKLPSPGGTKIRQPNGRQSDAPQELAPNELATNPSRREIGARLPSPGTARVREYIDTAGSGEGKRRAPRRVREVEEETARGSRRVRLKRGCLLQA